MRGGEGEKEGGQTLLGVTDRLEGDNRPINRPGGVHSNLSGNLL